MKNKNNYYINNFFMDPYLKLIEQIGEGAFSFYIEHMIIV